MKIIIIYKSTHCGNTKKVVDRMAPILEAEVKDVDELDKSFDLSAYDLAGFGSGIYAFKHHKELLRFVREMNPAEGKKVFIVSTSGEGTIRQHKKLREILKKRKMNVIDEFACEGFFNWGPVKLFGGTHKGHPTEEELKAAENFARKIKNKLKK